MAIIHHVHFLVGFGLEDLKYADACTGLFSGLLFGIPASPPAQYLTLSLRQIGFGTFTTNLLIIPSTIGSMITLVLITLLSEAIHQRTFVAMSETVWLLPFIIALYTLPDFPNPWVFYASHLPTSTALQVGTNQM